MAIAVTKAGPSLNIKEKHQALPYFKFSLRVTVIHSHMLSAINTHTRMSSYAVTRHCKLEPNMKRKKSESTDILTMTTMNHKELRLRCSLWKMDVCISHQLTVHRILF